MCKKERRGEIAGREGGGRMVDALAEEDVVSHRLGAGVSSCCVSSCCVSERVKGFLLFGLCGCLYFVHPLAAAETESSAT